MLQLLYILSFTILAFIAISNLIRNLVSFSVDRERVHARPSQGKSSYSSFNKNPAPHPELLDSKGKLIKEPLLVMRSINVEDARQQLDALYNASSAHKLENSEEI
jgi:hypothetical protein